MRVVALTAGRDVPSSRFRVRQYVKPLDELGVVVDERLPLIERYTMPRLVSAAAETKGGLALKATWVGARAIAALPSCLASYAADVTWLERQIVPTWTTLEPLLHRPVVLDVDDAIWVDGRSPVRTAAQVAKVAAAIMAGNSYLADWFGRHNANVHVIPTAIDTRRFRPSPKSREDSEFRVVWTGLGSNLESLQAIEVGLARFMEEVAEAVLVVVSDQAPAFEHVPADRVRFVRWSRQTEASTLQQADVGLMPLRDSEWNRGKCSFKMLQCMASGLPVVVSPVGLNAEILRSADVGVGAASAGDYADALIALHRDRSAARVMGEAGRRLVAERFSVAVVAPQIASVMQSVL
jgi:glycosyltransferase involved in cell wall biosynthesis